MNEGEPLKDIYADPAVTKRRKHDDTQHFNYKSTRRLINKPEIASRQNLVIKIDSLPQKDDIDQKLTIKQKEALVTSGYARNNQEAGNIIAKSLALFDNFPLTKLTPGAKIYKEWDKADKVTLLRRGHAVLYKEDHRAKDPPISEIASSITFIGDQKMRGINNRQNSAMTVSDCLIQQIPNQYLIDVCKSNPDLMFFLTQSNSIYEEKRAEREHQQKNMNYEQKAASCLMELMSNEYAGIYFDQHFISQYANISREYISKTIAKLAQMDIISPWKKGVGSKILKPEKLIDFINSDNSKD